MHQSYRNSVGKSRFTPLIIICITLILINKESISQRSYHPATLFNMNYLQEVQTGFLLVNNFAFEDARLQAEKSKQLYPQSSWPHLLQADIYWWKLISGENSNSLRMSFIAELELAKKKAGTSNDGLFCLIMANTYRTRLELLNNNHLAAIRHLKSYYHNLKKSLGEEENYDAFYITSGLYYYLAWVAWDQYPVLRPFLMFLDKGDRNKGIRFLNQAAFSNEAVISSEASYFLMKIYFDVEKDTLLAQKYASVLIKKHPGNFIYLHYYLMCLPQHQQLEEKKSRSEAIHKNAQLSEAQTRYFYQLFHQ